MSTFYKSYKFTFQLLILLYSQSLSAQFYVDVTVNHICPNQDSGSIEFNFDPDVLTDYSLSFSSEWENISTGDFEQFSINSLNYTINDLQAGNYEIIINLSDECVIYLEEELLSFGDTCLANTEIQTSYSFLTGGVINVIPSGGIEPHEILWDDGNTNYNRSGLNYGTYCFQLSDTYCCVLDSCITFSCPILLTDTTIVHHCSGRDPGEGEIHLDIIPFGTVLWNDGSTDHSRYGLSPGLYTVNVNLVDSQNPSSQCYEQHSFEILPIDPDIELIEQSTVIEKDCDHDGSIDITVWNGTYPNISLQYLWSNGNTTQDIDSLEAGEYCVTISAGASCGDQVHCFNVEPEFTVTHHNKEAMYQDPTSCDAQDGWITSYTVNIDIDPPTATFTKHLEDENNNIIPPTQIFTYDYMWENLGEGDYYLTYVTDMGCKARDTFELRGNDRPENHVWHGTDSACYDIPSGSAWVYMDIDTIFYDFEWSNGVVHNNMNYSENDSLYAGEYCVTITPVGTNCSWDTCLYVHERPYFGELSLDDMVSEKSCPFQKTGKIYANAKGGTPPYRYVWSDFPVLIGGNRTNLASGMYYLTLYDDCDREVIDSIEVEQYPPMNLNVTSMAGCPDDGGEVSVAVTGGTPGYQYIWSNGSTSASLSGLPSGTYSVTVTDSKGCYQWGSVLLQNYPEIIATVNSLGYCLNTYAGSGSAQNPFFGTYHAVGRVGVDVTGGDGPFTYDWNTGATGDFIDDIRESGYYQVTITDTHGCTKVMDEVFIDNEFDYDENLFDCSVMFKCGSQWLNDEWREDFEDCNWLNCFDQDCLCPIFDQRVTRQNTAEGGCTYDESCAGDQCTVTERLPDGTLSGNTWSENKQVWEEFKRSPPEDCAICAEVKYCKVPFTSYRAGDPLGSNEESVCIFDTTSLILVPFNEDRERCGLENSGCFIQVTCVLSSRTESMGSICSDPCIDDFLNPNDPSPDNWWDILQNVLSDFLCDLDEIIAVLPIIGSDGEIESIEVKYIRNIELDEVYFSSKDWNLKNRLQKFETLSNSKELTVYPNPSEGIFYLKNNEISNKTYQLNLYDIHGRVIIEDEIELTRDSYQLDLSRFSSGIYILQMTENETGKRITQKLIISK